MNGNGFTGGRCLKTKQNRKPVESAFEKYGGVVSANGKMWYSSEKALKGSLTNNIGKLTDGKTAKKILKTSKITCARIWSAFPMQNVLIDGVTFENSPWTTFWMPKHITIHNLTVKNPWFGTNNDALDLESSKNIMMDDCHFWYRRWWVSVSKAAVMPKEEKGPAHQRPDRKNCVVYHAHGGLLYRNNEMSGGVNNMFVSNCTFIGTDIGLRFKTTPWPRRHGGKYLREQNWHEGYSCGSHFVWYVYMAKDPWCYRAKKEPPVETKPVDESTPQFKFLYPQHHLRWSGKGIFVRAHPWKCTSKCT